jgi:hypothetical protein
VLDGGAGGAGKSVNTVELLGQRESAQLGSQMLRGHNYQALELVDRLGAADQNPLSGH